MIVKTPVEADSAVFDTFDGVHKELKETAKELEGLKLKVRAGEEVALTDVNKAVQDLRQFLKLVAETEKVLDAKRKEAAGIVNAYALDLDAARSKIGCQLSRIRERCCSGPVSG